MKVHKRMKNPLLWTRGEHSLPLTWEHSMPMSRVPCMVSTSATQRYDTCSCWSGVLGSMEEAWEQHRTQGVSAVVLWPTPLPALQTNYLLSITTICSQPPAFLPISEIGPTRELPSWRRYIVQDRFELEKDVRDLLLPPCLNSKLKPESNAILCPPLCISVHAFTLECWHIVSLLAWGYPWLHNICQAGWNCLQFIWANFPKDGI